jgi:hypothetical protein
MGGHGKVAKRLFFENTPKSVVMRDLGIPYLGINKLRGRGLETCLNERRCQLLRVPSVVGRGIKCWNGKVERSSRSKVKHQEKSCRLASLPTINPCMDWRGIEPGPPGWEIDNKLWLQVVQLGVRQSCLLGRFFGGHRMVLKSLSLSETFTHPANCWSL